MNPQKLQCRARDGRILRVLGKMVTDDPAGAALPDCPTVREHLRMGRLLPVIPTDPDPKPAPEKASRKKD